MTGRAVPRRSGHDARKRAAGMAQNRAVEFQLNQQPADIAGGPAAGPDQIVQGNGSCSKQGQDARADLIASPFSFRFACRFRRWCEIGAGDGRGQNGPRRRGDFRQIEFVPEVF